MKRRLVAITIALLRSASPLARIANITNRGVEMKKRNNHGWSMLGGLLLSLLLVSVAPAATIYVPADYSTIQAAITNAASGDLIEIADGTYEQTATLAINKSLTIHGASEAGVIIDASAVAGYGFSIAADDVTLSTFTLLPTTPNYPIHASGTSNPPGGFDNLTLEYITIVGAHQRTGFDIHGYNNVSLSFLTSKDATGGNGVSITGCVNVSVDNITTENNAWGSFAIYCSNASYLNRACEDVTIYGDTCSFGETNLYLQDEFGLVSTNVTVDGYEYIVRNMNYRPNAAGFYHYQDTLADATAFALYLDTIAAGSYIITIDDGSYVVADGMAIQPAIDAADPGDTITVDAGVYYGELVVNKSVDIVGAGKATYDESGDWTGGTLITRDPNVGGQATNQIVHVTGANASMSLLTVDGRYGFDEGTGQTCNYGFMVQAAAGFQLDQVDILDITNKAIELNNANNATLTDILCKRTAFAPGYYTQFDYGLRCVDSENLAVNGLIVENVHRGMVVFQGYNSGTVEDLLVIGNDGDTSYGIGFYTSSEPGWWDSAWGDYEGDLTFTLAGDHDYSGVDYGIYVSDDLLNKDITLTVDAQATFDLYAATEHGGYRLGSGSVPSIDDVMADMGLTEKTTGPPDYYDYPTPTTVWVDDDYCAGCENDGHVWGYDAFAAIQDGIDAVSGSTVHVANGIYTGPLSITSGVIIIGESEAGVIVEAAAAQTGAANTFTINAPGQTVTLQTMTIRHGDYGIRSSAGDVNVLHCTLYHNGWDGTPYSTPYSQASAGADWAAYATSGGAMRIENSGGSEIGWCTIYENDRGIRYQDGANGDIHDNVITKTIQAGIYLAASSYTGATGCTDTNVYDNVSSGNYEHGLLCIGGLDNSFTGNTCEDNWNTGMMIWHPGEVTVEGNTFDGNNAYGFNGVGNGADAGGTVAVDGDVPATGATFSVTVSGNDILNGGIGSQPQADGVHLSSPLPALPITVEGNVCGGMDIGVHVLAQALMTTVTGNDLSTCGVAVNNGVGDLLDASGNYYGSTDATTVAGSVAGNVDYTPWLGGGTDNNPGFTGDFATLYVDDDSPQAGGLGRVQEGVNLVTASTVHIAAGTYPVGVSIPTAMPMSLIGAGTTQTFLTGGMQLADGVTGLTLQHFALTGVMVSNSIIRAGHPNHDFTMDHVLIDGEGDTYASRHSYAGGRMTGDVTVTNCEFKDVSGWSLFDSASSGYETVMGTVIFANNHIHECDGAVAFRGDNTDRIDLVQCYGNVWENINDNFSSPSSAWACFEAHGVDKLEFHDNTMTNVAQNSWGEGQGLQTWRVGEIDVYENDFVDCWQGIWAPGLGTEPAPAGSIHDNNFLGSGEWAVTALHSGGGFTSGSLDARNNWWDHASGPYHPTLNPAGQGGNVSDHVLFDPWTGMATLGITPASSGPINCSQSSTLTFTYTPDSVTPPLRGYTIRVTATSEVSFTDADISIYTDLVSEPEYTDIVYNGPNDYTIDYAILGSTGGIDGAENFFDVTFHGDNAGADGTATVSFVSCELRDLSNAPIGNNSDATATIDVDCLAPTVSTMTAEPAYTQGLSNTVAWSDGSGSGAVLYYAEAATDAGFTSLVGNSGWIAGLSHEFTGLTDGQIYHYRVKSKDALDNESAFSAAVSSTQDDSPPATSADALAVYQTAATFDVAWTGADTDPGSGSFSGLATVELFYSYEGGGWTSYASSATSPISFTAPDGDGNYAFYTVGTDNVGNVEAAGGADATTQLDTTAPAGTFAIHGGAVYTTTPSVTLNNAITDATSGIHQMQFSDDDVTYSGWVPYAATYAWTLPGADGTKTVYAQFSDMAGNVFQTSDDIVLDTAAPGAVSDIDATPGHEEVVIEWTDPGDGDLAGIEVWRAVWHVTGAGNEQVSAYPEYDDDNPAEPTRPADYAAAVASAEWINVGTASAGAGTYTDAVTARGVYYYELFAVDMATNHGPAADAGDRATNYHLGDVQTPYGGTVTAGDISELGAAYGTDHGHVDYDAHCDVGPTDDASGSGIPTTDNMIGFEDLMIFALNYGVVTPQPVIEGSEIAHLTWFVREDGSWALGLTEPCANLKAIHLQARLPVNVEAILEGGGLLEQQSDPVFLRQIPGDRLDVSLAVLGEGVVITGQGLLFSVTLPEGVQPTDIGIVVRDAANRPFEYLLGATAVDDLPTAYRFAGNYPNPFNPKTTIAFDLPETQFVRLSVFSADGRRVVTLLDEQMAPGRHAVSWNGRDDHGDHLASGVYFARFEAGPLKEIHKMLLLK